MPWIEIPACTGASFPLERGHRLRVADPGGRQDCDLTAFKLGDITEWLSNNRSFDYVDKLYFSKGDGLYSNKGNGMLTILEDDLAPHDFLNNSVRSPVTGRIQRSDAANPNCLDNISRALAEYGVPPTLVPTPFNILQNTGGGGQPNGRLEPRASLSGPNTTYQFRAEMDLVIALSACSARCGDVGESNLVAYEVLEPPRPSPGGGIVVPPRMRVLEKP